MMNRMGTCFAIAAAVATLGMAPKPAAAQPVVEVVDLVVNSVTLDEGQLIADATITLDVVGRLVTRNVEIPLALDGLLGDGECDILHLSVGPVYLDILGLVVELDDCEGGPVTVDITALAGEGLLGDLLCGIANLLSGGLDLGAILEGLAEAEIDALTDAIRDVLNEVFGELLDTGIATQSHPGQGGHPGKGPGGTGPPGQGGGGPPGQGGGGPPGQGGQQTQRCDILTLEIPEGLELELLGLLVETSPICLQVYAERGAGNLLGNLLCSLLGLLDSPGDTLGGQQALIRNILRLLDRIG
jgi:hypothetical protein